MKKNLIYLFALFIGIVSFVSCSSDDDDSPKVASSLLKVSNAAYQEGSFPAATSAAELTDVSISDVESNGATTLKLPKNDDFIRYFIGIKNVPGYYVFTPEGTRASDDEEEYFDISIMLSNTNSSTTLMVSAETTDGNVTKPYEQTINYSIGGEGRLLKSVVSGSDYINFTYDSNGRLVKQTENWDGEAMSVDFLKMYSTMKTNSQGYITEITNNDWSEYDGTDSWQTHYSYDTNGHLISTKDPDGTVSYTWSDGNIVYVKDGWNDLELRVKYGNIDNPNLPWTYSGYNLMMYPDELMFQGLVGVPNAKLPSRIEQKDLYDNTTFIYEFTYVMNSDGTINKEIVKLDGDAETFYYSYY